ncbi:hypothetical protein G9A89_016902 [Geosiphon pyriformis]|nr:hypothetical protein G9A89_016902 [Geosiphon pyriformis]
MSEIMAHCSRNHSTSLGNVSDLIEHQLCIYSDSIRSRKEQNLLDIALVKDPRIRVGHSIENSLPGEILAIKLRKKLTKLWFREAMDKTITTKSLEPVPTNKSTVAESKNIGANHLGFTKFLFQQYCQHLGLTPNHILIGLVFNFYVNERIAYLLGTATNIESTKETFYNELIQNSKRKLQTPAVTLQHIQPLTWKKHKIELPTNPSYYYIFGSTINITAVDMSILNMTSTFGRFSFQSKQRKKNLLGPYNFGTASPWEVTESEGEQKEKKEESEDQEFTYQNLIPENPEFETPNHNQNNQNPDINNQQHLSSVIVINPPPAPPNTKQQQQPQLLNVNSQQININKIREKRPKTSTTTKFKVAITPDTTTLEYYQSIYTHCKQRFNILDRIEVVKKSVYQYIKNCINNYLFGNYNISEVRSNLYNNLAHYSQLGTKDLNSKTLATYFYELNFNIIKYYEETYLVQSQYSIDFESETETSNKGKNKLKQYSKTTPNTPTLPKTTAKHLQTPEQGTTENQSEHSKTAVNKENNPEISEEESIDSENEEDKITTYITKISEFNGENIETSLQEWLNQVTKAGDANKWNAVRMLRTIPYFLKETAGEWFENLAVPFNDWNTFKAAFLEQFTNNNTSITLCNYFRNIKQEPSKFVMTYIGKFNKLLRRIRQLKTNNYYSDAQILDQFIAGLKDKLIKKVCPHAPKDLNSAIQHAKRYEMAMEEANRTKLVNLAIRETSSATEKKIDQLTKKLTIHQDPNTKITIISPPHGQFNSNTNNHPHNIIKYLLKD